MTSAVYLSMEKKPKMNQYTYIYRIICQFDFAVMTFSYIIFNEEKKQNTIELHECDYLNLFSFKGHELFYLCVTSECVPLLSE